ncbi:MAG: type II secretion system F family protein [Conexivisphaerales archaeon]
MESKISIPTIMVPPSVAIKRGSSFKSIANYIASRNADLRTNLKEAGIEITPVNYIGAGLYSLVNLVIVLAIVTVLVVYIGITKAVMNEKIMTLLILMDLIVPFMYYFYYINYPKLRAIRRTKDMETHLPGLLRELLVKIRAGEPLFNGILEASQSVKGELQKILTSIVEKTEAGEELAYSIESEAKTTPSNLVRRVLEAVANAVNSGGDLSSTLDTLNDYVITHQQSEFQAYSRSLLPMSLAYMLICVVLPSLGNTIMVLLSSFAGINVSFILLVFPILVIVFEFVFISMIRQNRPELGV